jgi:hypothetical protein
MRLIDRLKPEYSSKLQMNNLAFPTLVGKVCKELEEISLVGDMKFGTWSDLRFFTGVDSPFDLFEEV